VFVNSKLEDHGKSDEGRQDRAHYHHRHAVYAARENGTRQSREGGRSPVIESRSQDRNRMVEVPRLPKMSEQRGEITMVKNTEPSLGEMLKAIPKLGKDDLEKLYWAVREEGRKKGAPFAGRFAGQAGHSRPR
jgi:hypothetical protein